MRQPLLLGRQGLPFAWCQPKLRQLVDLPLQPLDADGFLAGAAACRLQRPGRLLPALPALGQISQQSFLPGQPVQQLALGARAQQVLRFMLAMDVHQLLAQLTQPGNGAGVAIDLGT